MHSPLAADKNLDYRENRLVQNLKGEIYLVFRQVCSESLEAAFHLPAHPRVRSQSQRSAPYKLSSNFRE